MTNSITNRQMVFIIFLNLTTYSSIDLPQIMAQDAGRTSWIPIILTSLIFGVAAIFLTKLNNMYTGKVFFDYGEQIVGKFFTRVIIVYYLLYFAMIAVYLKLKLVGLLKSNFLPSTPEFATLIIAIVLFGFAAYKGITNIARMFEITGILFALITVGLCGLMMLQGMKDNVLPFFNPSDVKEFAKTCKDLVTPYGGIEVLLVIPFTAQNKKAPKIAFFTLLFIGLFYVLLVESTYMILGINNSSSLNDAFIEAIKVVEAPVIDRTDIFYLTFGLTSLFAGMTILYTTVVEYSCRLFSKVKRIYVVITIGLIFIALTLFGLSINNFDEVFGRIATIPVLISGILIPPTLFMIAKVKARTAGKRKNEGPENTRKESG